jgi:hypothetical protein
MSISDLASIGSLVSTAAVLVSLIYLGLQVRQAATNQRAAMVAATSARIGDQLFRLIEPHNADLYARMVTSDETYTASEIVKLMSMLTAFVLGVEDSYLLSKQGLLEASMFDTNLNFVDIIFALPVPRALWPFIRASFVPGFVAFFEARMRRTPLREQADLVEALRLSIAGLHRPAATTA